MNPPIGTDTISTSANHFIVLFDEFPTPTFGPDREADVFIGVTAAYRADDEAYIFSACTELMGLNNSRQLKNADLSVQRVTNIANLVATLPVQIGSAYLDQSNPVLQATFLRFENFGNRARRQYRKVRERKLAQLLHTEVMDRALCTAMFNFIVREKTHCHASLFIDNWSFPEADHAIEIDGAQRQELVNDCLKADSHVGTVEVDDLQILDRDSKKKRFIDCITSVMSRGCVEPESEKYVHGIQDLLAAHDGFWSVREDITKLAVVSTERLMIDLQKQHDVSRTNDTEM